MMNDSSTTTNNINSNSRFPFTASQWQELEHQALIFKYMASGKPVPFDLVLPIKRGLPIEHSYFTRQPNIGWGCYQMGYGRRPEDPEPGRCRRTDGKKWRCSKEAHPDSKYCERHMHRGKNRSRKPVEPPPPIATTSFAMDACDPPPHQYSTSFMPTNMGFSSDRECSWRFTPLGLGSDLHKEGGGEDREKRKQHHCFVLGADLELQRSERGGEEESQRPVRHFFDEWPLSEDERSTWSSSLSRTQLSISTPVACHDLSLR